MPHFPYKIKFPPGAIDGILAQALQMVLGQSSPQFHYDSSGSTIDFTPNQLGAVIKELEAYKRFASEDPEAYADMVPEIDAALGIINKSVMESKNIAQASRYDALVKRCDTYLKLALKK
jgi:hypothetical protein